MKAAPKNEIQSDVLLTPKQIEVRDTLLAIRNFRHALVYGGARSTKTFLLCHIVLARAQLAAGGRHLISRLHNIDVRTSVMMDTWPKMAKLCWPGVDYELNKSDQFATFENGSEVWFAGLDDKERVEKVLGKEYATIYVNEASQIAYDTILTLRTRLAQNVKKANGEQLSLKMLYDLNPVGRGHWTYREWIDGVDPVNGTPLTTDVRGWAQMNPVDNPHLPQETMDELAALPARQKQRFFEGEYLSEVPGALWPLDRIEALRVSVHPKLTRIVVAVDPSGSDGVGGDLQGIVVAGVGDDGHLYVLADLSCKVSPAEWAKIAVKAFHDWGADGIVAEANYGGAMVESTIRTADINVPVKLVNASRGKHIRAEPVAALYELKKAHHVGAFPHLEEQMGMMTTAGYQGANSPDRLDAMVWAATDLLLDGSDKSAGFLALVRRDNAANAAEAAQAAAAASAEAECNYAPGSVEYAKFMASKGK